MPKNIRFTPKQRNQYKPVAESAQKDGDHFVAIDDETYWIGKEYTVTIKNTGSFSRWYRVVITNLVVDADYMLFSSYGKLDPETIFEVERGAACEVTIVLGGEQEREPKSPRQFHLYVQEFATPEASNDPKVMFDSEVKWIPRPSGDSVQVTVEKEEIKVRPWQRSVAFDASVINRSYLPVTARIRVSPSENSKDNGLEESEEPLSEPIPAQTEQSVRCEALLRKPLKQPVVLNVDAHAEVLSAGIVQATSPKAVRIIPVPLLKAPVDWLVLAGTVLVLLWAVFGMPPVAHPIAIVHLRFDGPLPPDAVPGDLELTLVPKDRSNQTANISSLKANKGEREGNEFIYVFDWGTVFSGPRWTWTKYDLAISVDAKGANKDQYRNRYSLASLIPVRNDAGQSVSISRGAGVEGRQLIATLPHGNGVTLTMKMSSAHKVLDGDTVTLKISVNGKPVSTPEFRDGAPIYITEEAINPAGPNLVDIAAIGSPSGREAHVLSYPVSPGKEYVIPVSFGVKMATVVIPAGETETPYNWMIAMSSSGKRLSGQSAGGPTSTPVPLDAAREQAHVTVLVKGKTVVNQLIEVEPDKTVSVKDWSPPVAVTTNSTGSTTTTGTVPRQPATGKQRPEHGTEKPPAGARSGKPPAGEHPGQSQGGLRLNGIELYAWCRTLNIVDLVSDFSKEGLQSNRLTVQASVVNEGRATKLAVISNRKCWFQLYEVDERGNPNPILGPEQRTYPARTGQQPAPWRLDPQVALNVPVQVRKGNNQFILLACRSEMYSPDRVGKEDLLPLLREQKKVEGWSIASVSVNGQ